MPDNVPGGVLRAFMERHFRHFNAREVLEAARAYERHIEAGGEMMMSLAGAMSTAELGLSLAEVIRSGKVHAISCTGANLEEDVFNLLGHADYERLADWRSLSAADEHALYESGLNRVTDVCIPEHVMRHLEGRLYERWLQACADGVRKTPAEFLSEVFAAGELDSHYQTDPGGSWTLAAFEAGIPVYVPGWEDSTLGNMFTAYVMRGELPHHQCVTTGTEQFERLIRWYLDRTGSLGERPAPGFFQIGGGIAGDFAICAVPAILQDLKQAVPFWGYFCQITDSDPSYGGYSGAVPNEKITWGKLAPETPKFLIKSDATIVAPLVFGYLLGQ